MTAKKLSRNTSIYFLSSEMKRKMEVWVCLYVLNWLECVLFFATNRSRVVFCFVFILSFVLTDSLLLCWVLLFHWPRAFVFLFVFAYLPNEWMTNRFWNSMSGISVLCLLSLCLNWSDWFQVDMYRLLVCIYVGVGVGVYVFVFVSVCILVCLFVYFFM